MKKMSVASDSPVHSSSSDDLAAFLETELDSNSDSSSESFPIEDAAEDDAEVSNHRLKRRKLEHLETVDEDEIEEVASKHPQASYHANTQAPLETCALFVAKEWKKKKTGISFTYIHKGIKFHEDEVTRMRDIDMKMLQSQRKLCLVLDLDHTLLNSTVLRDLRPEEEYLKSLTHSLEDVSGGDLFMLEFMHMMTKLRPFVHSFLKEASKMFVLYIYTMGDRPYARQMAKLLDPKGEYFGERIISRDDGTTSKSLDVVLGQEKAVLILDDTENAWPSHKDNLIVIERYHFFASSCKQFDHRFQSLSQLKSDESEPDGALATVLKVLKQTHSLFFEVRWAIREKKFVVHRGWIDAANYLWKKQPEENFGLEQLKKQGAEEKSDDVHEDVLQKSRDACYKARDAFYTCLEKESGKKPTEIASVGLLYPKECSLSRTEFVKSCRSSWVKHFDREYCRNKRVQRLLDDGDERKGPMSLPQPYTFKPSPST
ncbi:LOW QUALITY PROTEIN: hypothetical protein HID58_009156 [Brassica napus]|uniref:RNA polymerase II C-terminal domain phosphatase-like n=1 Tax=Brassica napus TaxID=3708 RepID=A0ABQ8DRP8_BRANA|nr:LOW QUALITY PROTEIN: hypothetical protein HID58_009156 [Brassica napus]